MFTSTELVGSGGSPGTGGATTELEPFSFFVTSLEAMRRLSGSRAFAELDLGA